eukprot:1146567-Pelagomonas_calceolata.AAC.1
MHSHWRPCTTDLDRAHIRTGNHARTCTRTGTARSRTRTGHLACTGRLARIRTRTRTGNHAHALQPMHAPALEATSTLTMHTHAHAQGAMPACAHKHAHALGAMLHALAMHTVEHTQGHTLGVMLHAHAFPMLHALGVLHTLAPMLHALGVLHALVPLLHAHTLPMLLTLGFCTHWGPCCTRAHTHTHTVDACILAWQDLLGSLLLLIFTAETCPHT